MKARSATAEFLRCLEDFPNMSHMGPNTASYDRPTSDRRHSAEAVFLWGLISGLLGLSQLMETLAWLTELAVDVSYNKMHYR